jgi:hypothetical protein
MNICGRSILALLFILSAACGSDVPPGTADDAGARDDGGSGPASTNSGGPDGGNASDGENSGGLDGGNASDGENNGAQTGAEIEPDADVSEAGQDASSDNDANVPMDAGEDSSAPSDAGDDANTPDDGGSDANVPDACGDLCHGHGQCDATASTPRCICEGVWGNATCDEQVVFSFPSKVIVDEANDRALVLDDAASVFVVDLQTGNRSVLSGPEQPGPAIHSLTGLTLDAARGRALVIDSNYPDWTIFAIDLLTGERTVFSGGATGTGPALSVARDLELDVANQRVLVLQPRQIIGVDLATGNRSVVLDATAATGKEFKSPYLLLMDASRGRYLIQDAYQGLIAVDMATGAGSVLSASVSSVGDMVRDGDILLFLAYDDVKEHNLATGVTTTLASLSVGSGPYVRLSGGLGLDSSRSRVLVSNEYVGLLAIDRTTRSRSYLTKAALGVGERLVTPRHLTIDEGNHRALVTSDSGDIVEVDLLNGNRKLWTNIAPYDALGGIVIDAKRGHAIVTDETALQRVDMATRELAVLNGSTYDLLNRSTLAMDEANDRVLIANDGSLYAVDLKTGTRSVLSSSTKGTGVALSWVTSVALDAAHNRAFVAERLTRAIVEIDLATGTRSVLSSSSVGSGVALSSPETLIYDSAATRLLIADQGLEALIAVNVTTGARTVVSDSEHGSGPKFSIFWGLVLMADGQHALTVQTSQQALIKVDLSTGDRSLVTY